MVDTPETQAPPGRRDALAPLAMLTERYTVTFKHESEPPVPLAIGVSDRLIAELALDPATVHHTLRIYMHRRAYQKALAQPGAIRVGLDGLPMEPVSLEHQAAARPGERTGTPASGAKALTLDDVQTIHSAGPHQ